MTAPYPLLGPCVVIDAQTAVGVRTLMRDGLRRARLEGWVLPPEVAAVVRSVEALAEHKTAVSGEEYAGEAWCSTAEAAVLIGVSERQVRNLAASGRLGNRTVAGRLLIDVADAKAEADSRGELRKSAEVTGSPLGGAGE